MTNKTSLLGQVFYVSHAFCTLSDLRIKPAS